MSNDDEFFKFNEVDRLRPVQEPSSAPSDAQEPRTAPRSRRSSSAYSSLNSLLSRLILVAVIVGPIPVALNRPQIWLIWAALTAVVALIYIVVGARLDGTRKFLSAQFPWLFGLALVVPVFALLQGVPGLGGLVGLPIEITWSGGEAPGAISLLPAASQVGAIRWAAYILFAFLVIEVAGRRERTRRLGWLVFWGIVLHAAWSIFALNILGDITVWGAEKTAYEGSATGVFVNRNSFATFLAMGLVLGLGLVLEKIEQPTSRKVRTATILNEAAVSMAIIWVGIGIIALALVSTQSRMGVFAGVIGVAVCFTLMRLKAGVSLRRVLTSLLMIGGIAIVLVLVIAGDELLERSIFVFVNAEGRLGGYSLVLDMIANRPLLGHGFDAFRPSFELTHDRAFISGSTYWDRAHSTYLTHWSELGLIVGSIPIVLGLLVLKYCFHIMRSDSSDYALAVVAIAALTVGAVHSTVDFSLEMPANAILLVTLIGLGVVQRTSRRSG